MAAVLSPQERLELTRASLRELLTGDAAAAGSEEFPRSITMRLLLSGGGAGFASAALSRLLPGVGRLLQAIPLSTLLRLLVRRRH